MTENGHRINEVRACGGALNSELWIQTHADVSNQTIAIPRVTEAGTLGSAILAAVGAGVHPDVPTAVAEMTALDRHVEPRPEYHEAYRQTVAEYLAAYDALSPLTHRLARRQQSEPTAR